MLGIFIHKPVKDMEIYNMMKKKEKKKITYHMSKRDFIKHITCNNNKTKE